MSKNGEKLNQSFEIPLEKIEDLIKAKINGDLKGYGKVISPREVNVVEDISIMKTDVRNGLIRHIPLRGTSIYPYMNSEISIFEREPKGCDVGQKFALESKVLSIMKSFSSNLFEGFDMNGLSKMQPMQIYGRDNENKKVLAFYLPPIIEIHNNRAILIDGIHRNYIARSAGATINAIHISYIDSPLPFKPINWEKCLLVSEKPPKNERYDELNINLFRDLSAMGIDG